MNRSLLLVVCDFLLLSILALARFDVPKDAQYEKSGQKLVSMEVIERISDGENYDDVVAELEATNETLLENLSSDKDDLVEQKLELEEQIAQRRNLPRRKSKLSHGTRRLLKTKRISKPPRKSQRNWRRNGRRLRKKGNSCFKTMPLPRRNSSYWPRTWQRLRKSQRSWPL